jgi:hypothetical protein
MQAMCAAGGLKELHEMIPQTLARPARRKLPLVALSLIPMVAGWGIGEATPPKTTPLEIVPASGRIHATVTAAPEGKRLMAGQLVTLACEVHSDSTVRDVTVNLGPVNLSPTARPVSYEDFEVTIHTKDEEPVRLNQPVLLGSMLGVWRGDLGSEFPVRLEIRFRPVTCGLVRIRLSYSFPIGNRLAVGGGVVYAACVDLPEVSKDIPAETASGPRGPDVPDPASRPAPAHRTSMAQPDSQQKAWNPVVTQEVVEAKTLRDSCGCKNNR